MGRVLSAVVAGLIVSMSLAACDKPSSSSSSSSSSAKKNEPNLFPGRSLKEIAEDKSIPDGDAIKAYVLRTPGAPLLFPQGQSEWATVEPSKSGGHLLFIRRLDPVSVARTYQGADFDPLQKERDGVKYTAEFCRTMLTDLKSRNLKGISYTLLGEAKTTADGKMEYMTMFSVSMTPDDLPMLAKAQGEATAGSVFDPRTQRVKEILMVDNNLYPQMEYVKKSK